MIEWPEGEAEPAKYAPSSLPGAVTLKAFVDLAKLRWRIERDDQELKQGERAAAFAGLGHLLSNHRAIREGPLPFPLSRPGLLIARS